MSLVEQLGGMTVGEFLERVTGDEIALWKAYSKQRQEQMQRQAIDERAKQNRPKV